MWRRFELKGNLVRFFHRGLRPYPGGATSVACTPAAPYSLAVAGAGASTADTHRPKGAPNGRGTNRFSLFHGTTRFMAGGRFKEINNILSGSDPLRSNLP